MTVAKALPTDLIDSLLSGYKKPEDLIGGNGLLKQITKALVERALQAEMAEHLGHAKHDAVTNIAGNTRNGKSSKTLKGEFGELPIEISRDRHGSFEPQLISKHQTRWHGFDDKILSMYARGMVVREIQSYLEDMYGIDVLDCLSLTRFRSSSACFQTASTGAFTPSTLSDPCSASRAMSPPRPMPSFTLQNHITLHPVGVCDNRISTKKLPVCQDVQWRATASACYSPQRSRWLLTT